MNVLLSVLAGILLGFITTFVGNWLGAPSPLPGIAGFVVFLVVAYYGYDRFGRRV